MTSSPPPAAPRPRRLLGLFIALAVLTAVAVPAIVVAGHGSHGEPAVAGRYELTGPDRCLGRAFDLEQSGRFVTLRAGGGARALRLRHGRLTGQVTCRDGTSASLRARATPSGLAGTVGGEGLGAALVSDPPEPGSQPPRPPGSIAGQYALSPDSACIGSSFELKRRGDALALEHTTAHGRVTYRDGRLTGTVSCERAGPPRRLTGDAMDRELSVQLADPSGGVERLSATTTRTFSQVVALLFLAIAVVMLVARAFGSGAARLGQPRVMGEVVAGIALGPTLLGAVLPDVQRALFPSDLLNYLGVAANLGLIFYMFLVGLEVDPAQLRGRLGQAAAISNTSVVLPMLLGLTVALPLHELLGPDKPFLGFALFMGVAMSITAFPVLARILVERRLLKRPLGALTLACAAIDDVTAWFLIALATAVAVAGSTVKVLQTIGLAVAFCALMGLAVRPLLARVSAAYDEAGRVPVSWIAVIFAGVLLSAYTTEAIGIAVIFGAFVMGLVMPRRADLTEDVTRRLEDFVVTVLLPLFFAYTGLKTNVGLLDRPVLWLLTLLLVLVAIAGKFLGATLAARLTGFGWRPAAVIGTLMNTRGLTELIVLNLALEKGIISLALFAMLVIMALVTTFMAGPVLALLDPRNELGSPVEEELDEARRRSSLEFPELEVPAQSILLAPQSDTSFAQLVAIAEPLARTEPPRELILARLVPPPSGATVRGGLQTEDRLVADAVREAESERRRLIEAGVPARAVAFVSSDPGADIAGLAAQEDVALVLLDGRRPLLGDAVPRGDVARVLHDAPCDVAVLVAREGTRLGPGDDRAVLVPFGGAEHDWAALELGAWIAGATGAPLKVLGAAGQTDDRRRLSRLVSDAGLLVQSCTGVRAEPVLAEGGRTQIVEAAAGAALLVVGLSDRWRREGLGPVRAELARGVDASVLFVRRGRKAGALASLDDVTHFTWSASELWPRGAVGSDD